MTSVNSSFNFITREPSTGESLLQGAMYALFGGGDSFNTTSLWTMANGGYGLGGMYGTPGTFFGTGGLNNAQMGMTFGGILAKCTVGAINSHKAAKKEAAKTLEDAYTTLGITDASEYPKCEKEFNKTACNKDILSAINDAKDELGKNASTKPTEKIEPKKDENGKEVAYIYNNKEYGSKNAAENAYKEDLKRYNKYQELLRLEKEIDSIKSESLDSKLFPKSVIKAFEAREAAEEEYNDALALVKEEYDKQQAKKAEQTANNNIDSLSKDQKKNKDVQPLIKAYNTAKSKNSPQARKNLYDAFKKIENLVKSSDENKTQFKSFEPSLNGIVSWYNTHREKNEAELTNIDFS